MNQKTIEYQVSITGVALNSGDPVKIRLSPAPPDTNISFYPTFGGKFNTIQSHCNNINSCLRSTNISNEYDTIYTIEHLMSAIHACDIDNMMVTVDGGNEIPILDGSSQYFYNLIKSAGVSEQKAERYYIGVDEEIKVDDGDRWIRIEPYDGLVFDCTIAFDHPRIGVQNIVYDMNKGDYFNDVSKAKTFGFFENIKEAKDMGMLKGGNKRNAIVLYENDILNPPLRYPDEFVRHKLLDLIGDVYINGPIKGYITSYMSGHCLNNKLMREVYERYLQKISC